MKNNKSGAEKTARVNSPRHSKIKIYITCFNNKIEIPKNDLFELVQGGAANAPRHLPGMLHDDEGENISKLNPRFNDAATIYWAWKNFDNDYYGFFQYRRFLSFDTEMLKEKKYEYPFDTNDAKAFEKMHLTNESEMRDFIEKYDVVTCNYLQYDKEYYSLYQQFCEVPYEHEKDLNLLLEIIQEKYPEYMPAVRESLFKNGRGYFANLFIMKKKYFQQLCQWMFDVLFEFDKRMDYTDYNFMERRVPGFLSERMLGIFYTYLEMETDCKFGMLQKCFFMTTREKPLDPIFEDRANTVPVVLASSRQYLPYCSVTVQSVLDHASPAKHYDIVVFHEDVTNYAIKRFSKGRTGKNVSIRFVNVASYFDGQGIDVSKLNGPKEAYYRYVMGDVLALYDRAIYLDSDVIVKRDLGELLNADLSGCALAAGFKEDEKVQPGVFVCNLKEFRELLGGAAFPNCIEAKPKIGCQEIFDKAAKHVRHIDMDPWAIHYAGPQKPWNEKRRNSREFWETAVRSALYRDITARLEMRRFDRYFPGYDVEQEKTDDRQKKRTKKTTKSESNKPRVWENLLDDVPFPDAGISPAFDVNNVPVVMLSSQYYLPFLAVTIQSVIESGNKTKNFDIIVLTDGMERERIKKVESIAGAYNNVSVRVVNIQYNLSLLTNNQLPQYAKLIYSRVWLAYLLLEYDQVLCVDSDMIVLKDISPLVEVELGNNYVLASHEWCYGEYGDEIGLKDCTKTAFNAGLMVQNLTNVRKNYTAAQLIALCNARDWKYVDQDVLNILFAKKVMYLDYDWNYRMDLQCIGALNITESLNNPNYRVLEPKIIHFAGAAKPWSVSGLKYEEKFWSVAARSLFYQELILMRRTSVAVASVPALQSPNLIPVDHPARKYLDLFLPKGSRRREFVKRVVRAFK